MRKTPLRPGSKPLSRKSRLVSAPPRATGRPSQRFAARRDPKYCAWIRALDCCVPERGRHNWIDGGRDCSGRVECAHVTSRGAGGNDRGNTVPLCTRHHREQHAIGILSFHHRYGADLAAIATQLEARWVRQQEGIA